MILVTGAAGKTGRAVIAALARQGVAVRAYVYRPDQVAAVVSAGATEASAGDLLDRDSLAEAMRGIGTVYHICPNMHRDEEAIGRLVIGAAESAGVDRLVYHSVLHPQTESMPHHWQKLRVEAALFESSLAFTIVQPTAYMQNVLAYWPAIVEKGLYRVPYSPATRLSLVDLQDVAAVAGRLLVEGGHEGAIYELVGTKPLSQHETADQIAQVLGRPVRAERLSLSAWSQGAAGAGLGRYQLDSLQAMFTYYDRFGLSGNPNVLSWLLGRRPNDFRAFLQRHV